MKLEISFKAVKQILVEGGFLELVNGLSSVIINWLNDHA